MSPRYLLLALASSIALAGCTDCAGGAVYVSAELQRVAVFVDRIEVLPNGGAVQDPRGSVDKRIRISFLLPVLRSSLDLSTFGLSWPRGRIAITRMYFDDNASDTARTGTCTSLTLDIADALMETGITAPLPATMTWDASRVRFSPAAGDSAPTAPTEPVQFTFVLSPAGPTGTPVRPRFGFPAEPSPAQPGWGRSILLSDLPVGLDGLERVGRDFVLGSAPAQRVRPHAPLQIDLDRETSTLLISGAPYDPEGISFRTGGIALLTTFRTARSRTERGMLPDTEYRVTLLSRDTGAFLPAYGGTQDASGNWLMPRYASEVISAALGRGLTYRDLASDIEYRFRTAPVRVASPLNAAIIGPSVAPSRAPRIDVEYAEPAPELPASIDVALYTLAGALVQRETLTYPTGWSEPSAITQSAISRTVRRRTITLAALPAGTEGQFLVRTSARDAMSALLGEDEIEVRLDFVAPLLTADDVVVANRTGSDDQLEVCAVVPRDTARIEVSFDGGQTTGFDTDGAHCQAIEGSDELRCCGDVAIGYPEGTDEVTVWMTITAIDDAGNRSIGARVVSQPDCAQPARRLVRAGSIGAAALTLRSDGRREVMFVDGGRLVHGVWIGDRWRLTDAFTFDASAPVARTIGFTHTPSGRPFACVEIGQAGDAETAQSTLWAISTSIYDPASPEDFTATPISSTARLDGCSVARIPSGTDRGVAIAYSQWLASAPSARVTIVREAGATTSEWVTGSSHARRVSITASSAGRLHVAFEHHPNGSSSSLVYYGERTAPESWSRVHVPAGAFAYARRPVIALDGSATPWVAMQAQDIDMVWVAQRSTSSTTGWSDRWYSESDVDRVDDGRALGLVSDGAAGMYLAFANADRERLLRVIHLRTGVWGADDVIDTAGDPRSIAIAVDAAGRRVVLYDERRDPRGRGRASLHLHDDGTGLVLRRDPSEPPLARCAAYHTDEILRASAMTLTYPMGPFDFLVQPQEDIGNTTYDTARFGLGTRHHPFEQHGTVIEEFGATDSLLTDALGGVAMRVGRGALRYQSAVCVPRTDSGVASYRDPCEVHHPDASLPDADLAFTPRVERAPVTREAPDGSYAPIRVDSYSEEPDATVCARRGQQLYFDGTTYHCIRCTSGDPADTRSLVYAPQFDRCMACPVESFVAIPRVITDAFRFECRSCNDANDQPFDAGEEQFAVAGAAADQCVRCSPGTIALPCSADADCGEQGDAFACGFVPGPGVAPGSRVCVRAPTCESDADCTYPDATCVDTEGVSRCRVGRHAVARWPLSSGIDPLNQTTVDFLCSPLGCHQCWQHTYCGSDAECPVNHRCMNQSDGTLSSSTADPSNEMPYPTPMCLLRPLTGGQLVDLSETFDLDMSSVTDRFTAFTQGFSLPRSIPIPNGRIGEIALRVTDARAEIVEGTPQSLLRVRVAFEDGSYVRGETHGVGFEAELHDSPAIRLDLVPYVFDGRIQLALVSSAFEGDLQVSSDSFGGPVVDWIVDKLIRGILGVIGEASPDSAVSDLGDAMDGIGAGLTPFTEQLYEDSLLRAIFVRPFRIPPPLVFEWSDPGDHAEREHADVLELAHLRSDGLHLSVRDGR